MSKKRNLKQKEYVDCDGPYFCPSCHRQVRMPFTGINAGSISIGCPCNGGVVIIKNSTRQVVERDTKNIKRFCSICNGIEEHGKLQGLNGFYCKKHYSGTQEFEE